MNEIDNILSTIDDAASKFNGTLSTTEKKLLDECQNLIKELSITNGRIDSSIENLKLVSKIKTKLNQVVLNKEYLKNVAELANNFSTILDSQMTYFSTLTKKVPDQKKYALVKQLAVDNTVTALTKTGIEANITGKLNEMLLKSITTGGQYTDLVNDMTNFLTTTEQSPGALTRYAQTYVNTALNQYAGQNNKLLTDDLDLNWFVYVGSNKTTTREFCEHLVKKRYVHKSELPKIVDGYIDGFQCAIYERTGLPYGMIDDTTVDNFQVNCGGWNCGHKLVPVNEAIVPKNLVAKFM